jgi:hypothetical protein
MDTKGEDSFKSIREHDDSEQFYFAHHKSGLDPFAFKVK